MAAKPKKTRPPVDVDSVLEWLERQAKKSVRDGMARYAIPSDTAFGVSVGTLKTFAKGVGRDHALALGLWDTERYEARMLATFVDDPEQVTPAQMERWCKDFDNWAICDTACFALFDRTPHAFAKIDAWSNRREEFQKRAAFALLASLAGHDKKASDEEFLRRLPLIEAASTDERNFVKKGVNWALRSVGSRSVALHEAALFVAKRLAASDDATARWNGKDAVRALSSPVTKKRLAAKKKH